MPGADLIAGLTGAPVAAVTLAVALLVGAVALRHLAAAFSLTVVALALGSCSIVSLKETFLTARWGALFGLAVILLLPPYRPLNLVWRHAALAVLPALALASAAWSVEPRLTFERSVSFGVLIFVVLGIVRRQDRPRARPDDLILALAPLPVLAVVASALVAVLAPDRAERAGEFRGIFENPNGLGLFIGLTFPFVLAAADRRMRGHPAVALLTVPAAAVVLYSSSRSGLLALVVGGIAYELARRDLKRLAAQVALVAAAAGIALALGDDSSSRVFATDRADSVTTLSSLTGARDEAWAASIDIIRERPLLGHGFGTGDTLFDRYPEHATFDLFQGDLPHNAYLQLVLELGIVPSIGFFVALVLALGSALRMFRRGARSVAEAAFGGVLLSGAATLLVESVLIAAGAPWSLLIWAAAAMVIAARPEVGYASERSAADPDQRAVWGEEYDWTVNAPISPQPAPPVVRRSTLAIVIGLVAFLTAVGALALGVLALLQADEAATAPSADEQRKAEAFAGVVAASCDDGTCRAREVTRIAPGLYRAQIVGEERVSCALIDVDRFRVDLGTVQRVATVPCTTLSLVDQTRFTVAAPFTLGPAPDDPLAPDVGYQVDVVEGIAERLGLPKVRWVEAAGDEQEFDFQTGLLKTDDSGGEFGRPYLFVHFALLVPSASELESVEQATRARLGIYGSLTGRFVDETLKPDRPPSPFARPDQAVAALRRGRIEGIIVDDKIARPLADGFTGVRVAGLFPQNTEVFAFWFPRGSDLRGPVDRALNEMASDGTLRRLQLKWFPGLRGLEQLRP